MWYRRVEKYECHKTITQLGTINYRKNLQQLSQFMGTTFNTHCREYGLSDSFYQTAKNVKTVTFDGDGVYCTAKR